MIAGIITGCVVWAFLCWLCYEYERREELARHRERMIHREVQNREWRAQFNQLPTTVRAAIRMVQEDRRETARVIALFVLMGKKKEKREKVDWKKEGF